MKIAVIGAGRMGALRTEDLVKVGAEVTVFNRTLAGAKALADKFNSHHGDISDIQKSKFDGYVVATATDSHIGLLDNLIPLGKPILCEKPISLTVEDTDSVIEVCKKFGTQIQVGFQRRFDPPISKAAKMVASGQVGSLYTMHMYAHDHLPSTLEFLEGSGSIYRDLHVHDFDLIRWITQSEISKVYATQAAICQVRRCRCFAYLVNNSQRCSGGNYRNTPQSSWARCAHRNLWLQGFNLSRA